MFRQKKAGAISYFVFEELEAIRGFLHAFTSRLSDLPIKDAERARQVAPEKASLLEALGLTRDQILLLRQTHSDCVITVGHETQAAAKSAYDGDGIIVLEPGYFPVIRTADCLPIFGILAEQRRLCAFHAGWRGTRDRIASKGVSRFVEVTGSTADRIVAVLGPCIRRCCYEVGPEVRDQYAALGHETERIFLGTHLDLAEANRAQLEAVGVRRILDCGLCTGCRTDLFYSYRREGATGRQWAVAGFTPAQSPQSLPSFSSGNP